MIINWPMIQALSGVAVALLLAADSAVYYFWHAKHERERTQDNVTFIWDARTGEIYKTDDAIQACKELSVEQSGK